MIVNTPVFILGALLLVFLAVAGWWLIIIGSLGMYCENYKVWRKIAKPTERFRWYHNVLRISIGVVMALPLWCIEFVRPYQFVQAGAGQSAAIVRAFSGPTILWQTEWNRLIGADDRQLVICWLQKLSATSSLHPLTDNPKVRSFKYAITVETDGTPESIIRINKELGTIDDLNTLSVLVTRRLQYLQFEFNEKHSRELATFYNPLDEDQQKRFAQIAADFFTEPLAKVGVRIVRSQFVMGD